MKKRLLISVLICVFVFRSGVFVGRANAQSSQDVKTKEIIYKWQTDPEEFAKFFFGEDLSVRSPRDTLTLFREKANEVKGLYVEWTLAFGISPLWLILPEEKQIQTKLGNPGIYHNIGPDKSGWMNFDDGSRLEGAQKITWEQMTWGIPPQCDVRLKMKIENALAMILKNGMLYIGVEGSDLEIETASKRCDWPGYKEKIPNFVLSGQEIRVKNAYEFPVKVGLRSEDKGIDFIVPASRSVSALVPGGKYNVYFQYAVDPESLYQGDALDVGSTGIEIRLKEAGDYNIRKIKNI